MYLRGAKPFIVAVVPFDEVRVHLRAIHQSGQLARAARALQGTCENIRKADLAQSFAQSLGVTLTRRRQRQVRKSRVLAREAPFGLPMAC
jgi:hypothetical protein